MHLILWTHMSTQNQVAAQWQKESRHIWVKGYPPCRKLHAHPFTSFSWKNTGKRFVKKNQSQTKVEKTVETNGNRTENEWYELWYFWSKYMNVLNARQNNTIKMNTGIDG